MSLNISVRKAGPATILEIAGRMELGSSGASLQEQVREVLTDGQKNLILDLAGLTYMDSSGLGQLVGSYATAVAQGAEIRLLHLNRRIRDLMQITKLYTVFAIYSDEEAAVRSFDPVPA